MSELRIGQVIDALIAQVGAADGFRLPTDTEYEKVCTVWDGPAWQVVEDHGAGGNLIIGWGGNRGTNSPSATSTWESGPIAGTNRPRDEVTQLACMATAQRHMTPKEARDEVTAIVSAMSRVCRADPSLGINTADSIGGVRTSTFLTGGSLTQFADRGFTAEFEFTVTYKTRV